MISSSILLVVERPDHWPFEVSGVEVAAARAYLTDPAWAGRRNLKVFNLCRSYRYQSLGYYVSLLAEARGHRPLPSVATIQDLKSRSLVRFISEDLEEMIQRSLKRVAGDRYTLSIYFGKNPAQRHQPLALRLHALFPAPLLRAELLRREGRWQLESLRPVAVREIPAEHREFVIEAAREHFAGRRQRVAAPTPARYDLAILVDPAEKDLAPSDERALRRFERAARDLGLRSERIGHDDYGKLPEYDALFIRQTTHVDHYTYRFSRRAAAEGLVVIDDPQSIVRCTNKVYLAEVLRRAKVPTPRTLVVHRDNLEQAADELGLPAILKLPDGSFSQAVERVDDRAGFRSRARRFFESSDLAIAQEYLPTGFDWRVGVLDREVLFAARYKMVRGHWQIARHEGARVRYGGTEAVALGEVPKAVLDAALAAANLIGDGFYGVDVKEKDGRPYVIEVNDNPNVDDGCEDGVLGDELYRRVMRSFVERIERLKEGRNPR